MTDNQKPNYALLNYKVKNTPNVEGVPQRKLDPVKIERKRQGGVIDIAEPDEHPEDTIESVEDPTARNGQKSSHLRQLHALNKVEAQRAIQSIVENN